MTLVKSCSHLLHTLTVLPPGASILIEQSLQTQRLQDRQWWRRVRRVKVMVQISQWDVLDQVIEDFWILAGEGEVAAVRQRL